ncbi:dTDP-3-amino-3,4,6-trideoxy-alpha-D-glucopyranose N,N-dimethyltransferase [Frankliniella fusca]|uniref:dTDP-3-amino-3,4, 6-trideoxy-alpha-D-glucopyranose N,N-dimethyltransferase n=1 Tax=Frankliniella fusca TaxID=407009 RepID=A0AAE1HNK0_9NEOP|nr:dTDP-3-amino-3,4,6-trideoxy-alpha-D-glucopyranose N,N-dimethyltransferase [Frankliniella fusca]
MTAPESITASQLTPLMVHFTMGLPGVGKSCGLREVSAAVLTTLDAATSSFPVSASTTTTTTTSETTAASSATPTRLELVEPLPDGDGLPVSTPQCFIELMK